MNTWLKRTGVALAVLLVAAVAALLLGKHLGERKMARTIRLAVAPVELSGDSARIEQGRYLFRTRGCADCHGANGGGMEVIKDGAMLVVSPNLTSGPNSAVSAYNTLDWVRTLRHGVKPNGKPVLIMPSEDYNRLSDADLGALISYVQQLPPVAGAHAAIRLPLAMKVRYAIGQIQDAAEKIDHSLAPSEPLRPAVTAAYGAYIANSCMACHGEHLSGGRIPDLPSSLPPAANLTPGKGSAMLRYPTVQAFMAMLRSGQRPDGSAISPLMPFASLREMTDTDMGALHAYLTTLPPREAGQR